MSSIELQNEVRIVAEISAKPDKIQQLRQALLAMIPPSVAEAGCRQYELHEDREHPGRFVFVERWVDAAAFDFHTNTPHFQKLGPSISDWLASPVKLTKLKVIS